MNKLIAAASVAALAMAVPVLAQAQSTELTGLYGSLGYGHTNAAGSVDVGAIQGRLGYRANPYLGLEGELGYGINGDKVSVGATDVRIKQRGEAAAYGVGFLPIGPQFDLTARIGYGTTKFKASAAGVGVTGSQDSWNYGVGGQYRFDGVNGIRADFTRKDFTGSNTGHADVYSVGYVRRF
ncbi:porin family protein [Phenylobacterium immobile]|uniref:porin family protein n=1 Tax=Phenylobacterium immobile TaxID=21 RepID=UPI000A7A902E|nr:porin family protein [Phenylobacterium immobile]